MPNVAISVASAGTPARDATNRPPIRLRRASGSSANRAGSSDSSTPKKTSGRKSQPSTIAAPPRGSSMPATRGSSSRPGMAKAAYPPAANPVAATTPSTKSATRQV
jgi:hypothetical protein